MAVADLDDERALAMICPATLDPFGPAHCDVVAPRRHRTQHGSRDVVGGLGPVSRPTALSDQAWPTGAIACEHLNSYTVAAPRAIDPRRNAPWHRKPLGHRASLRTESRTVSPLGARSACGSRDDSARSRYGPISQRICPSEQRAQPSARPRRAHAAPSRQRARTDPPGTTSTACQPPLTWLRSMVK
jgi:hypothetical protein